MHDLVSRIGELERLSAEDGVRVSRASAADFLCLAVAHRLARPALSVTDGGTFRAVWKGEEWQAGLHFLGGGQINFVVTNSVGGKVDRNYGRSAMGPIRRYLKAVGVWHRMRRPGTSGRFSSSPNS